jgi:hypothetical protein
MWLMQSFAACSKMNSFRKFVNVFAFDLAFELDDFHFLTL